MATFHAKFSFALPDRDMFVIDGEVVEGIVRPGMILHIFREGREVRAVPVHGVEMLMTDRPSGRAGIVVKADASERAYLQSLNISNEDLAVTPTR